MYIFRSSFLVSICAQPTFCTLTEITITWRVIRPQIPKLILQKKIDGLSETIYSFDAKVIISYSQD